MSKVIAPNSTFAPRIRAPEPFYPPSIPPTPPKPTPRGLFGTAAAMVAGAGVLAATGRAAPAQDADAELITLCNRLVTISKGEAAPYMIAAVQRWRTKNG
jgi:hypothetical protein